MLESKLNQKPLPLWIAGVEYLGPIFRQASKYNHLMKGMLTGSFTSKEVQLLHQKSWEIAEPYFLQESIRRKENFGALQAESLTISNNNIELIKAAMSGAVETLLVKKNHQHLWGIYDAQTHKVHLSDVQEKGIHCLIDETAVKVIELGGKVYLIDPNEMPEINQIAGILRYPKKSLST